MAPQPPTVNAGPDQTIILSAAANLNGTVSDNGLPDPPGAVGTTWSEVSGPGMVTLGNASALDTTASFSQAGTYVLCLTAIDGQLTAAVGTGPGDMPTRLVSINLHGKVAAGKFPVQA